MSRWFGEHLWVLDTIDIYADFDDLPRIRRNQPQAKKPRKFPKRLKNEGSETANAYHELALATIGETMWTQMKEGELNWSRIDDKYFAIAERLGEQLETYDPNEVVVVENVAVVEPPLPIAEPSTIQTKKPKKKRDRRIKIRLQEG